MKTDVKEKAEWLDEANASGVTIDPSLNQFEGKVLFPQKLALAEEKLKGVKLPKRKNHRNED